MKISSIRNSLMIGVIGLFATIPQISAQSLAPANNVGRVSHDMRDGSKDFDFLEGSWKGSMKLLQEPLTGSTTWVEYEVTQLVRKVGGGRGLADDFTAYNPKTKARIDGLTLHMYKPESREWYIYWSNLKQGIISLPPTIGQFVNGRGEFYGQEDYKGRMVLVRFIWSDITPDSNKFEQSYSIDGGKTWEPNWIAEITRVKN